MKFTLFIAVLVSGMNVQAASPEVECYQAVRKAGYPSQYGIFLCSQAKDPAAPLKCFKEAKAVLGVDQAALFLCGNNVPYVPN